MVLVKNFTSSTNHCGLVLQPVTFVSCIWEDLFLVPSSYSSKLALALCFPLLPIGPVFRGRLLLYPRWCLPIKSLEVALLLLHSRVSPWIYSLYLFTGVSRIGFLTTWDQPRKYKTEATLVCWSLPKMVLSQSLAGESYDWLCYLSRRMLWLNVAKTSYDWIWFLHVTVVHFFGRAVDTFNAV